MIIIRHLALLVGALLPFSLAAPTIKSEVIPGKYIVTPKKKADVANVDSHMIWVTNIHKRSRSKQQNSDLVVTNERLQIAVVESGMVVQLHLSNPRPISMCPLEG
jgi:hypothetical protein